LPSTPPTSPLSPYTTLFRSGPKMVLDVPATLERLETLCVPLLGYGCDECPAFYTARGGLVGTVHAGRDELPAAGRAGRRAAPGRSEEHTSELQSLTNLLFRL